MLKNYTSSVPAERSVAYIEHKLVSHGAANIVKRYGPDKKLEAIMFQIETKGQLIPIFLPARIEVVYESLKKSVRRPSESVFENCRAQAERTAWKIISDWVDVQFAMIELDQAEFLEVFLPYVWSPSQQRTFFQSVKDNGYKLLGDGK